MLNASVKMLLMANNLLKIRGKMFLFLLRSQEMLISCWLTSSETTATTRQYVSISVT